MRGHEKTTAQKKTNFSAANSGGLNAIQKKAVSVVQKAGPLEEPQQHKSDGTIQKAGPPEMEEKPSGVTQHKILQQNPANVIPAQRKENKTGMPDNLKSGIENLSGMSMDHVRVHYNSSQPAQLNALAYAQGSNIHVGPGHEKHLPHEAWHVVQQAQGRVQPTMQMKAGVPVNDDPGLEHEADVMGERALSAGNQPVQKKQITPTSGGPFQFTIVGGGYAHWAKNVKGVTGKKLEQFTGFLKEAHDIPDIDFSLTEIDGFYDKELSNLTHTEMGEDKAGKIKKLKRYAALVRDDEGGHGAEKHGEPGDKFLVDRVNARPRAGAFTASSLKIDDFLQWDTLLKRDAEEIYAEYIKLANARLAEIVGAAKNEGDFEDAGDARDKIGGFIEKQKEFSKYTTSSEIVPKIALSSDVRLGGITQGGTVKDKEFKIPIGAEALGLTNLHGRSVSRPQGVGGVPVRVGLEDVVDVEKKPESYTGGLSPVYTVDEKGKATGSPDKKTLDWVTKY